ncbi:transporter substrate-binding domain-containing protein [Pelomonas sp. V22]|uniref:substrate-binding periplasmic protein n=1 Tax=Pelomonas sp. V22 TaxID=2822139 RepID=UPI0024A8534B|nr:transporter substrate-binding domain-containing protein [Pelomonas sp. V22]MDI4635716.1 transporter substrate-binding domain-containing protein [Pelomonas sp. V22]
MPAFRRRLAFRALALMLCALPGAGALACGPYQVGIVEHGRAAYRDAAGRPVGVDHDLVEQLARRSGCALNVSLESPARIWDQFTKQGIALATSIIVTPERARLGEIWPYAQARNHALLQKDLAERVNGPEAFLADPRLRAVVVRANRHGPQIDGWIVTLRAQGRVHEVADYASALRTFKARRAELMFITPGSLRTDLYPWLAEMSLQDWAPQDDVRVGLLVARDSVNPADHQQLQQAFKAMRRDGSVDAILRRHMGEALARRVRLDE